MRWTGTRRQSTRWAEDVSGLTRRLARWGELWGLPDLARRVTVEWSPRFRRSLGRAFPRQGKVRLSTSLLSAPTALLHEALCHEVAHIAVGELYTSRCRPHGPEWAKLVLQAGFEPRTRLAAGQAPLRQPSARRRPASLCLHRCPVCHARRIARRPVPGWRCAACVSAGLSGRLEIVRRPASGRQ
jgi:predicted SprT family Zn-dependent metalloprotease